VDGYIYEMEEKFEILPGEHLVRLFLAKEFTPKTGLEYFFNLHLSFFIL
jgi:hypothetical protein